MNYLPGPGSYPYGNPNGAYSGYMMPMPLNDRKVNNNYIIDQRSLVNQPYQYPQQSFRPIMKRNASLGPSMNQNYIANNKVDNFSPNLRWKNSTQRYNAPTFNAYSPVNYDSLFPGVNNNNLINNRHAPVTQIPSTFALASNSLLQRRDIDIGNKSAEFMGFPNNQMGNIIDPNSHHLPQLQTNSLIRSNLLNYHQSEHSQGLYKERTHNPSLRTLPRLDESPNKSDRRIDRTRNPLVRVGVGVISLDDPRRQDLVERARHNERYNIHQEGSNQLRNRNSARYFTRTEAIEEINVREQRRNNHQLSNNNQLQQSSQNMDHAITPTLRPEQQQYSLSDLFSRPATIRVTIANQDLTNMSLQNLRNVFDSDETFGQELIRINEFINCMIGTPENQTNWVTVFIEQFFNQFAEEQKLKKQLVNSLTFERKPGLNEDAIEKLKTKKFKNRKKLKAKKTTDESTTTENLCAICLVDYEEGDLQCFLSCDHNFHKECIAAWLKKKAECPTCRKSVE